MGEYSDPTFGPFKVEESFNPTVDHYVYNPKWEYKQIDFSVTDGEGYIQQQINRLGEKQWEGYSVAVVGDRLFHYFKRQKIENT